MSYNNIIDKKYIENNKDSYEDFTRSNEEVNKALFVLNNNLHYIMKKLFEKNSNVSKYYHQMSYSAESGNVLKLNFEYDDINTYLSKFKLDINDPNIRYVFVKVNLFNNTLLPFMNHVNCIIVDKEKKHIMFFEPKYHLQLNAFQEIEERLKPYIDNFDDYVILLPESIGYTPFNRLQKFDAYCQSYILYIYVLLVQNEVSHEEYAEMFNSTISSTNLQYFLFYIHHDIIAGVEFITGTNREKSFVSDLPYVNKRSLPLHNIEGLTRWLMGYENIET